MPRKKQPKQPDDVTTWLLSLICLLPETDSPRGIFAGIPPVLYYSQEALSPEKVYTLSEAEYTTRQAVEKMFSNERMQIEALFCVSSEKMAITETALINGMELAARQLFFISVMKITDRCVNTAIILATFQEEETKARAAIIETEKNERIILEWEDLSPEQSSQSSSANRLFSQPATTPAALTRGSWATWFNW